MALLWVAHVDGVGVFPKVPAQLREYHKSWERNECIKAAMKLAESDVALLQKYLIKTVPEDFGGGGMDCNGNEEQVQQNINLGGSLQENVEDGMQQQAHQNYPQEQSHVWLGNYPLYAFAHQPTLPFVGPRALPQSMRRDPTSGNVVVGGYAIGANHGLPTFECTAKRKRKKRCRLCRDSPDPSRNAFAEWCNGRGRPDYCQWMGS